MVFWGGGPTEPEEADGQEDAADEHGREAGLRDGVPIVGGDDSDVARLVGQVDGDGAENADEEAEEGEGADDGFVVAVLLEDDGEDFEGEVEETIDEGGIGGDAGDHWFGEEHAEGTGEVFGEDGFGV